MLTIEQQALERVNEVETWQDRAERLHGDNDVVTHAMIQSRMQEEIDDLRAALARIAPITEGE